MLQQMWKVWSNFVCPLGPFSLAQSHFSFVLGFFGNFATVNLLYIHPREYVFETITYYYIDSAVYYGNKFATDDLLLNT